MHDNHIPITPYLPSCRNPVFATRVLAQPGPIKVKNLRGNSQSVNFLKLSTLEKAINDMQKIGDGIEHINKLGPEN